MELIIQHTIGFMVFFLQTAIHIIQNFINLAADSFTILKAMNV